MRKALKILATLAILLLLFLLFFPISVKIEKTVSAVEIALDDIDLSVPVTVSIAGTYSWRLFGADTFRGDISFDSYTQTIDNKLEQTDRIPALTQLDGGDHLDYGEWLNSQCFGYISWKPFFSSFVVQVYRPQGQGMGWNTVDGHCIVSLATDRDEALKILKHFSNEHLPPYEYWIS